MRNDGFEAVSGASVSRVLGNIVFDRSASPGEDMHYPHPMNAKLERLPERLGGRNQARTAARLTDPSCLVLPREGPNREEPSDPLFENMSA